MGWRCSRRAASPGERGYPLALARRLLELRSAPPEGYEALEELNRELARRAPVLVSVDDLDDGDRASLDWLAFAARRLQRVGVAFVLAGETVRFEHAVVLSLRPFSERAVAALLHVELGHAVEAGHARACHAATGGRALLVCELAAAARGRPAERVPPGVAAIPGPRADAVATGRPAAGRCDRAARRRRDPVRRRDARRARPRTRRPRRRSPAVRRAPRRGRRAGDHPAAARPGALRGAPACAPRALARPRRTPRSVARHGDPPPAAQRAGGRRVGRRDDRRRCRIVRSSAGSRARPPCSCAAPRARACATTASC